MTFRKALATLVLAFGLATPVLAPAAEPTIDELLNLTDDIARGESSVGSMAMHVKTSTYERTVRMKVWTKGTDRSLVVIEEPAKERGTATLKVGDNIWNYLPKVDRTMKVPASMMSGSWMGSHFTNDDLVKENRLADEYTATMTDRPQGGQGQWVIELVPKPTAPVVWGKVVVTIEPNQIPREIRFLDEKGKVVRTMTFSDVRDLGGRRIPTRMRVVPGDKPAEYTEVVYEDLRFDVAVPDATFTLQALKR